MIVGATGLPLKFKIMPEYFNDLGYKSVAVGKWHLGSYRKEFTPTFRGFQSHVGYWTGHEDYYDHSAQELYGPVVRKYIRIDLSELVCCVRETSSQHCSKVGGTTSEEI